MGFTVRIEDENGNAKKTLSKEFVLADLEIFYNKPFRLLKYIDPYGNTTFNSMMFEDLIKDLLDLKKHLRNDNEQIDEVIKYAKECSQHVHTYLKFYGD